MSFGILEKSNHVGFQKNTLDTPKYSNIETNILSNVGETVMIGGGEGLNSNVWLLGKVLCQSSTTKSLNRQQWGFSFLSYLFFAWLFYCVCQTQ